MWSPGTPDGSPWIWASYSAGAGGPCQALMLRMGDRFRQQPLPPSCLPRSNPPQNLFPYPVLSLPTFLLPSQNLEPSQNIFLVRRGLLTITGTCYFSCQCKGSLHNMPYGTFAMAFAGAVPPGCWFCLGIGSGCNLIYNVEQPHLTSNLLDGH